jgi:hypothetical protein
MNYVVRAVVIPSTFAALIGLLAGCSSSKPNTDAYTNAINESVGEYVIKDLQCASFADTAQEKSGRGSCRGTLALKVDLYAPVSPDEIRGVLVAAGIPSEGAGFFYQRHFNTVFRKISSQGDQTPFSAECSYSGNVNGWNISCSPGFQSATGQPLGSIGPGSVVKDTNEYTSLVNNALVDFHQLDAGYKTIKEQVERFFAPGKTVTAADPSGAIPFAIAKMNTAVSWTGPLGFLGKPTTFVVNAKYQDLRANPNSTFCGYVKGTPGDDIEYSGNIGFAAGGGSDPGVFTATVDMMNRAGQYNNNFQSCGSTLTWNGSRWKGSLSPFDLTSN